MSSSIEGIHANPWFEDGNVVLTAGGKHFRVHRGVLSSYSTVFKDMFLSSHPEGVVIEDCPVVSLPDSALDVQIILEAMYDRGYYPSAAVPIPFPTLAAFMRLGKKYLIHRLFDLGKEYLERYVMNLTTKSLTCDNTPSLGTNIINHDRFKFQFINLAREIRFLSVLPAALFICAHSCPVNYLVEGYDDPLVGPCKLSPENQLACLRGRDVLPLLHARLFKWLRNSKVKHTCDDPAKCTKGCSLILQEAWVDSNVLRNPLVGWEPTWETYLCLKCRSECKRLHKEAREEVWVHSPMVFGLAESWEELEKASFTCTVDTEMS